MNASHEEAVEFAKISKRENRVYVGNLSYDVRYGDLKDFRRGGGWLLPLLFSGGGEVGQEVWYDERVRLARIPNEYPITTDFTTFSTSFVAWLCWVKGPEFWAGLLMSGCFWGCSG